MLRVVFLFNLALLAFSCGFQQLQHPPLEYIVTDHIAPPKETRLLADAYENIRIYADYSYLDSIAEDQRDYIKSQIMPSALDYYQTALKVTRLTDNLQISKGCAGYYPSAELAHPGVEADLVILVVAEDMPDVSFVAGAMPCGLATSDNRPVYGLMLFNLAYLPMDKVTDDQENLSTALHELAHVLGFNADFYDKFIDPTTGDRLEAIVGQMIVNDNYVTFIDVEPLTSKLRTYFNCSTLEGAYLEDEGDSGSAGSHFERRVFMNEYMTASSIPEPVISEFTLALLEGTGWYKPNYNMTEPFTWGKGQGCDFLDTPCVADNGTPNFPEFCDGSIPKACTYTSRGIGYCGTGSAVDYFADGCPYYQSSSVFDCKDVTNQASALLSGEIYGLTSRCFTGTLVDSYYTATYGAYCFATHCQKSGSSYTLTLTVGNHNVTCAREGTVSVAGFNGLLNCPDPQEFCVTSNPTFCEKGCSGRGTCVNNVCQCPPGWTGTDCAERLFDATCSRCAGQTGTGCYGDECIPGDIGYGDDEEETPTDEENENDDTNEDEDDTDSTEGNTDTYEGEDDTDNTSGNTDTNEDDESNDDTDDIGGNTDTNEGEDSSQGDNNTDEETTDSPGGYDDNNGSGGSSDSNDDNTETEDPPTDDDDSGYGSDGELIIDEEMFLPGEDTDMEEYDGHEEETEGEEEYPYEEEESTEEDSPDTDNDTDSGTGSEGSTDDDPLVNKDPSKTDGTDVDNSTDGLHNGKSDYDNTVDIRLNSAEKMFVAAAPLIVLFALV